MVDQGAFRSLPALTFLDLSFNHFRLLRLSVNMFSDLTSCEELSLSFNGISEIDPGSFNGLGNLKSLHLCFNLLTALNAGMFQGLRDLKLLVLELNRISVIDDSAFIHTNSINELHLGNNKLTHLSEEAFSHLSRPLKLRLHKGWIFRRTLNQLQCDSDLCWLRLEELQGNITWLYDWPYTSFPPTCANGINWPTWRCTKTGEYA